MTKKAPWYWWYVSKPGGWFRQPVWFWRRHGIQNLISQVPTGDSTND